MRIERGNRKLTAFALFCATVAVVQWLGRTPEIVASALDCLWIGLTAYMTGNVGTHWASRAQKGMTHATASTAQK